MAFTEQGVAMLSSVLRSDRAADVNIAIMRTFVQLRRLMDSNRELARKISEMEKRYDEQFRTVFQAIQQLITEEEEPKRRIGFGEGDEKKLEAGFQPDSDGDPGEEADNVEEGFK